MRTGLKTLNQLCNGDWWVDETGQAHSADGVDVSFDNLFMRHLGHMKVAVRRPHIQITWDVSTATQESIGHIAQWLCAEVDARIRLRYFLHGWAEETQLGGAAAANRMHGVQMLRAVHQIPSTYIQDRGAAALHAAPEPLRRSFDLWSRTGGHLADATLDECSELLPHVLFYRPDKRTGELVFVWVGSRSLSMMVHGRAWSKRALMSRSSHAVGSESEAYVSRIASAYGDVWETGDPHYARVQTLLRPNPDEDPVWLTYHRLLLRLRLHDGKPALMCLSSSLA